MFRRILVAFDGSPRAQRALEEAVDLAQASLARLTIVTVVPQAPAWIAAGYGIPADHIKPDPEVERRYEAVLGGALDSVGRGLPVTGVLKHGSPGLAILAEAELGKHDLIVMGAHSPTWGGAGSLRRVAATVLRASAIPVLLISGRAGLRS